MISARYQAIERAINPYACMILQLDRLRDQPSGRLSQPSNSLGDVDVHNAAGCLFHCLASPFNQTCSVTTTTCTDGSLGRTKDVADHVRFYSVELVLQSRLVEDTALSHSDSRYRHINLSPTFFIHAEVL